MWKIPMRTLFQDYILTHLSGLYMQSSNLRQSGRKYTTFSEQDSRSSIKRGHFLTQKTSCPPFCNVIFSHSASVLCKYLSAKIHGVIGLSLSVILHKPKRERRIARLTLISFSRLSKIVFPHPHVILVHKYTYQAGERIRQRTSEVVKNRWKIYISAIDGGRAVYLPAKE